MKLTYPVVAGTAALVVALTACSSPGQSETPQETAPPDELTMLVTASPSATGLRELAEAYTSETGIAITFVEVPTAQLPTKIILATQSGQATFDLAQVDGFTLPQVVQAGALAPLDDYLAEDEEYDYADFAEGLQNYAKQDGTTYGLPLSTEPVIQMYRTDLFEELGLAPATTWQEALTNAAALTGAGYYGWATAYGPAVSAHYFNQMLYGSGGRLLDHETFQPLLDTDHAKQVMEQFLSMSDFTPSGSVTAASADMINAFTQLDVGQLTSASGWYGVVSDPSQSNVADNFAITDMPMTTGGPFESVNVLNGWLVGISSVSAHQQAAWDFAAWALGKDNVQAFMDAGAPPPARISTTTSEQYLSHLPHLAAVGEAVTTGTPIPRIPEMAQLITVLSQNISAMATGQLSLDEGMAKSQEDFLNILVQSGRYTG